MPAGLGKVFGFLDRRQSLCADGGGWLDRLHILPRWIATTRLSLPLANLPAAWQGATIAHLSDLHAGPICGLDYVRRVVRVHFLDELC